MKKGYAQINIHSSFYEVYFRYFYDNSYNVVLVLDNSRCLVGCISWPEIKAASKQLDELNTLRAGDIMQTRFDINACKQLALPLSSDLHMTSYAQFNEDVVLQYALYDVPHVFYIDVGAYDPEINSVTNWFYTSKRGSGINIEPQPEYFGRLEGQRRDDINIHAGCGSQYGYLTLHVQDLDSTFVDQFAHTDCEDITIAVMSLADICKLHVPALQPIHFLKIDVEGFEQQVLQGADFKHYRPWIIVIESNTLSTNTDQPHANWEDIVLQNGYVFIRQIEINRYYVSNEMAHISHRLLVNVELMRNVLIYGNTPQELSFDHDADDNARIFVLEEQINQLLDTQREVLKQLREREEKGVDVKTIFYMKNAQENDDGTITVHAKGHFYTAKRYLTSGVYTYEYIGKNFEKAKFVACTERWGNTFEIQNVVVNNASYKFQIRVSEDTKAVQSGLINDSDEDVLIDVVRLWRN